MNVHSEPFGEVDGHEITQFLLSNDKGLSVAEVSRQSGVTEGCLRNWKQAAEERRALRTMHLATLVVGTARPLSAAVSEPDRVPPLRRLTARNARVSRGKVRVPLHTLAMNPDVIEARLRNLHDAMEG